MIRKTTGTKTPTEMNYNNFQHQLSETLFDVDIKNQFQIGQYLIKEYHNGSFGAENKEFNSFQEAYNYIAHLNETKYYWDYDNPEPITDHTVANTIKEFHNKKITNTVISEVQNTLRNKLFSLDPVIESLRKNNLFENKVDFILRDGSRVFLNKSTLHEMIKVFGEHTDITEYLNESASNLVNTVKLMENI